MLTKTLKKPASITKIVQNKINRDKIKQASVDKLKEVEKAAKERFKKHEIEMQHKEYDRIQEQKKKKYNHQRAARNKLKLEAEKAHQGRMIDISMKNRMHQASKERKLQMEVKMEEMKNFREMPMKFKASKVRKYNLAEGSMFQSAEVRSLRSDHANSKSVGSRAISARSTNRKNVDEL